MCYIYQPTSNFVCLYIQDVTERFRQALGITSPYQEKKKNQYKRVSGNIICFTAKSVYL